MKRVIVVGLALSMVFSVLALADTFGEFKSGVGAQALAMGGAFVAVANGTAAVMWNPAGLAQTNDTRIGGMDTQLSGMYNYLSVAGMTTFANFGIGLGYERMGSDSLDLPWSQSLIRGSLATSFEGIGMIGATVKYYTADAGDSITGSGLGFDVGFLFNIGDMVTIGANASDVAGTTISWTTDAEDTVLGLYKVGAAFKLLDGQVVFATDVDFTNDGLGNTHAGLQFALIPELALRGGIVLTKDFEVDRYTIGAGINIAGFSVDLAYQLINAVEVDNTLVLSAELSLGSLLGETTEEAPATE